MTAYEYWEIAHNGWAAALTTVQFGFAVFTGYIVVAYTVGVKLRKLQVVIMNLTYSLWMVYIFTSGTQHMSGAAANFAKSQDMLESGVEAMPYATEIYGAVGAVLLVVSLWFMWDIRNSKS